MVPAQQRLDPADLPTRQRHLGLPVHHELAGVDRPAQVTEQAEPLGAVVVELAAVHAHPEAAVLGGVHGDVGVAQQRLDVGPVVAGHRDPDAGLDVEGDPVGLDATDEGGQRPGRELLGGLRALDARQQDGELVTAEPRDGVGAAHRAAQPFGHRLQHHVAVGVAERVVDLLEPVEVDEHEGDAAGCRTVERRIGPLPQQRPVGQAGERVVQRLPAVGLGLGDGGAAAAGQHDGEPADDQQADAEDHRREHQEQPLGALHVAERLVGQLPVLARLQGDLDLERVEVQVDAALLELLRGRGVAPRHGHQLVDALGVPVVQRRPPDEHARPRGTAGRGPHDRGVGRGAGLLVLGPCVLVVGRERQRVGGVLLDREGLHSHRRPLRHRGARPGLGRGTRVGDRRGHREGGQQEQHDDQPAGGGVRGQPGAHTVARAQRVQPHAVPGPADPLAVHGIPSSS
jgi:hypothetical protein